jgi:ABC-2 type transport system ATP-binding protein
MGVIEAVNLSKWYGNVLGISEVSVKINKGVVGILGPNGAGKSTFLKIIAGMLKPNLGKIMIKGKNILKERELYKIIGYCPEVDSFYMEMTGFEFIYSLLKLSGFSDTESKKLAETALENVGLTARMGDSITTYSLGMRQRLKFAQSIAHEPDILIFDEPLRGIDPLWKSKLIKLIKEFKNNDKTIIVSSHILPEIESITENIILIHQGKIFAEGNIHYIRDLIDTHPHMISIESKDNRELASALIKEGFVKDISFKNEKMIVKTDNRELFYNNFMKYIAENNIEIFELTSPDDNLQAVFDYLVGVKR